MQHGSFYQLQSDFNHINNRKLTPSLIFIGNQIEEFINTLRTFSFAEYCDRW